MKCLICKEKTNNRILCSKHLGVDNRLRYLTTHKCNSFIQKVGEPEGICKHHLMCEPIKKALKREVLMIDTGHVICPHASMNLSKIVYSEVNEEEIRSKYPECIE